MNKINKLFLRKMYDEAFSQSSFPPLSMKKIPCTHFTDTGDGTVTDNRTNLIWQKECGPELPWDEAMEYAEKNKAKLPGKGWRLPTVKELQSLVDYGSNFVELTRFFSGVHRNYWSATTYSANSTTAWYVSLSDGYTSNLGKTVATALRCVHPAI